MKNTNNIINEINCDNVYYGGSEMWKPHRNFDNFKLTYKELGITKKEYENLIDAQRSAWHFCDTIFLSDLAEHDEHIFDYCFHGERMKWKAGDEFWLVYNIFANRFEFRRPDENKWTPLEKYYINDDLELRFKFGYLKNPKNFNEYFEPMKRKIKYLESVGVNSFQDRIDLSMFPTDKDRKYFTNLMQIFDYYKYYSSLVDKETGINKNVDFIFNQMNNEKLMKKIEKIKKNDFFENRKFYGLYNENEKEEEPEEYYNIFLKYSHQLKFYQNKHSNLKGVKNV